ncbi:mitochondrial 37S ribosomal protein YmS-T [Histoplasma capsulatum var. duboisii H88]|uniref:Mitochondrial 37S ribosomal protein YmS-T n=1 Tax=Ajellomyces capsulatus (strain H88) TaxID=544711 RepID=A0A8A1LZ80_AJEC8|nr:mitochondrial 37S ribosomal protein YmS-T [Histoplasma capsulatum var. duboisii H88]
MFPNSTESIGLSHRSGKNDPGFGETSWFRWSEYACAFTRVFRGILSYPARVVNGAGVIWGCIPGIGEWRRSVSITIAPKSGKSSIAFGCGNSVGISGTDWAIIFGALCRWSYSPASGSDSIIFMQGTLEQRYRCLVF